MLYQVHILKVPCVSGNPRVIEKRAHTASSDLEAIKILKENLHVSAPTASWFSLKRKDGAEIYRWFKTEARNANGGKHGVPPK
jgi:hypothetical protein